MSDTSPSILGPLITATLLTNNLAQTVSAYCNYLDMTVVCSDPVTNDLASLWRTPELAGTPMTLLQSASGRSWLRVIECDDIGPAKPLQHRGWMALEICVSDVDDLYKQLVNSPFDIIGKPANLAVSDDIRAMQVVGPAGEVLYLTEIKKPVPPFELPQAQCSVDDFFICVLACHDRNTAIDFYEQFSNTKGIRFDTKITVVNRAFDKPIDTEYPVGTIQFQGNSLIEIDEITETQIHTKTDRYLTPGITMVSMGLANIHQQTLDWLATPKKIERAPYLGCYAGVCVGAAGELVEFIETTNERP